MEFKLDEESAVKMAKALITNGFIISGFDFKISDEDYIRVLACAFNRNRQINTGKLSRELRKKYHINRR